jgi:hypothetical protein
MRRKIMKKGLLVVLVVAMGLALATGPAFAQCSVSHSWIVGTAGAPGVPTLVFVWDLGTPGSGLVFIFTTTDQAVITAVNMATVEAEVLFQHGADPRIFNVVGTGPCPVINFGTSAGDIAVYNYSRF